MHGHDPLCEGIVRLGERERETETKSEREREREREMATPESMMHARPRYMHARPLVVNRFVVLMVPVALKRVKLLNMFEAIEACLFVASSLMSGALFLRQRSLLRQRCGLRALRHRC